jgi:hypothetical protein
MDQLPEEPMTDLATKPEADVEIDRELLAEAPESRTISGRS